MKPRNAYALPAKARKNAGPMCSARPRLRALASPFRCPNCGEYLDADDDSVLCIDCESEAASCYLEVEREGNCFDATPHFDSKGCAARLTKEAS